MKGDRFLSILFVIMAIVIVYYVYRVLGGDWSAVMSFGRGGANPLDQFTDSLSGLGQGIVDSFSGFFSR